MGSGASPLLCVLAGTRGTRDYGAPLARGSRVSASFKRTRTLYRLARPGSRGECRRDAAAPVAGEGRAGHRQDRAGARSGAGAGPRLIEWHIKSTTKAQQGLYEYDAVSRLRDGQLGRSAGARHRQLHRARQAVGRVRGRRAGGGADRRGRQGGHRVPQRPAARTRSHAVLRLRDAQDGGGEASAGRDHHLEQREGAAGRVPAPLLLPLHPLPRSRDDGADRAGALSGHPPRPGARGAERVLPDPRGAGPEEEAQRPRNCWTG